MCGRDVCSFRSSQQKQPEQFLAEIWRHRRIQRMRIHLRLWINHEVSLRYDAVADLLLKSAVMHLCRRKARDLCSLNTSAVISSFKETDFWTYLFSSVCVSSFYTPLTMSLTNPQLLSSRVCSVVFKKTIGHLQPSLWQQNQISFRESRSSLAVFVVPKLVLFYEQI